MKFANRLHPDPCAANSVDPGRDVELAISGDYIELCKALKLLEMAASGGEAKLLVGEGLVRVDGELETRKRRKLYPGSVIELLGKKACIVRHEDKARLQLCS